MLAIALSILLVTFQATETGTVIGLIKLPNGRTGSAAQVVLLPPKYTDLWNKQVQQRMDNYWEIYKSQLLANKDQVPKLFRLAHVEALQYVIGTVRREMGNGASKYIKETSSTGQFEFRGIPFGTYQLVVQANENGEEITWTRLIDVQTSVPIFVDLGKPAS